ncbi:GMC oxidoreductase [alpha proteobacterium HIMB5]|nr:GMC oxidoreductase [alpha proteobacterium HIMB5]
MALDCDYLIIGTGPAGSVLSCNLADNGSKVILLDRANNLKKTDKNSFIFSPYIENCPDYYTPLFSNQLGGNSALWNNKVYLISEDEFKSGDWGFGYNELIENSKELAKKFKINHDEISKIIKKNKLNYSQSKRVKKFGNIFDFLKIKDKSNIQVFSNSSPIGLNIKNNKIISAKVFFKDYNEKKDININKDIIFCAGGLGNPAIIKNLIYNDDNLIGKNLCDHAHINLAEIKKENLKSYSYFGKYFINDNDNNLEQNLYIKDDEYFAGVNFDFLPDPARILKRIFIKSRSSISKYVLKILIKYYSFSYKVFSKILSILNIKGKYSFEFFFSQKKNTHNNLEINHNKIDSFGLKKLNINWNINKEEQLNYEKLINELVGENGKLVKTNKEYLFDKKKIFVGLHPSCTTHIGKDNINGCVDNNLKLFNYDNIYVSGSSVFSINGFTNPTWTIMVLSHRLSKFLLNKNKSN